MMSKKILKKAQKAHINKKNKKIISIIKKTKKSDIEQYRANNNEALIEDLTNKTYFTTYELMRAPWFPIKSHTTIRAFIKAGRLKAKNISLSPNRERWRIAKEDVIQFLVNLEDAKTN